MEKKFVKSFAISSAVLLLAVAATVLFFDPFFVYHAPVSPLKAVAELPEYQCAGTIRTFDYDSIILGSSVAENYNNEMFDQAFGCTTIKGIQTSGSTQDLLYYLKMAYESHEIRNVFYSLDLFALADGDNHILDQSKPVYLYNNNRIDDIRYLWNKDVLFEKIPYMVAQTMAGYEEGLSYNWAKYKDFSKEIALANYPRPETVMPDEYSKQELLQVTDNLEQICEIVGSHPETEFYFIYPPYSKLWWDRSYRDGNLSLYVKAMELSIDQLLEYSNAKLFYFQSEREIVCNLDIYMDPIHYSDVINDWMVEQLSSEEYCLTKDNKEEELLKIKELTEQIIHEENFWTE